MKFYAFLCLVSINMPVLSLRRYLRLQVLIRGLKKTVRSFSVSLSDSPSSIEKIGVPPVRTLDKDKAPVLESSMKE